MPRDSSGNYSLPPGYLAVTGQTVLASQHNPPLEDIGTSLTASYVRDGRAPMLGDVPMNGYRATGAADGADGQDYVTLAQVQALIAAIAGIPTGSIVFSAGTIVPPGWLAMNGQAVSRTTYANLYAFAVASGNLSGSPSVGQFGPGDGSTTFTLPNLYSDGGSFLRPIGAGRTIGSLQADELRSHNHSGVTDSAGAHWHQYDRWATASVGLSSGGFYTLPSAAVNADTQTAGAHSHNLNIAPSGGTETRPKNVAYPALIKT